MKKIIAKSNGECLYSHSVKALKIINEMKTHGVFDKIIESFQLTWQPDYLFKTCQIAILAHDLGKANSHMQNTLVGSRKPNLARHEVVSAYILEHIRDVIHSDEYSFHGAFLAVAKHHLKDKAQVKNGAGSSMELMQFEANNDLTKLIKRICGIAKTIPTEPNPLPSSLTRRDLEDWIYDLTYIKREESAPQLEFSLVLAIVIFADTLASTNLSQSEQIDWLKKHLTQNDPIDYDSLIRIQLKGRPLRKFQVQLELAKTRIIILEASTGSGKSAAALIWAKSKCNVYWGLPQKGLCDDKYTHLGLDNLEDTALYYSSRRIRPILNSSSDLEEQDEKNISINGFDLMGKSILVCTTQTILGFLQCKRTSLVAIPAMATGAFIFDEVHFGGDRLFGHILKFIEIVKRPVLLMSATLTQKQREQICKAAQGNVTIVKGDEDIESVPRYQVRCVDEKGLVSRAVEDAQKGHKVLWIVNTVKHAQKLYKDVKQRFPNTILLHSRYIPEHRQEKIQQLIAAFNGTEPVIAIATQVAEMSLDISATRMYIMQCPLASFIQRLGRLVRFWEQLGIVFLYWSSDEGNTLIYKEHHEEMRQLMEILKQKEKEGIYLSQADLRQLSEDLEPFPLGKDTSITFGLCDESHHPYTTYRDVADYNSISIIPDMFFHENISRWECKHYAIELPAYELEDNAQKICEDFYRQPDNFTYSKELGLCKFNPSLLNFSNQESHFS